MATSAHSTPQTPRPQVSNCADLTLYRYRARLVDGDVYAEVCLSSYIGRTWRTERHIGRVATTRGAMGARQKARAQEMLDVCLYALIEALTVAGWREYVDKQGAVVWEKPAQAPEVPAQAPEVPAQAPEVPAQAPEVPAQEPAQEPRSPATALLPWQGGGYVSATSRRWQLAIVGLALLELYHHEHSGRYEWLICAPAGRKILDASHSPGYTSYDRAERAMLLALARVMHPRGHLPTSLPPR